IRDFHVTGVQTCALPISPRSNARLLSALRAFYGWRVRQGLRKDDPTALLEPPSLPRLLPKALSEAEVERLLAAPDTTAPDGVREDRSASCRQRAWRRPLP